MFFGQAVYSSNTFCLHHPWIALPGEANLLYMAQGPIEVFDFLDYREYLRAYYDDRKENGRGFSYRAFARKAGLKSPNYLKLVIDGDRNLTPAMAIRFGKACGLEDEGLLFFEQLVAFNQAKTSSERAERYRSLSGHKDFRRAHKLDLAQAAYHGEWFIPAIRELALRNDFRADAAWIAERMVPRISKADAARALRVLFELDLLVEDDDGRVHPKDTNVTTGAQTRWVHIGEYHRTMMKMAAESIDNVVAAERDITSLTLCVDEGKLAEIKEELARLRHSLMALADDASDPAQVVQINFQLFPLSTSKAHELEIEGDE